MTRQLSIFDTEAASVGNGLTISHHLNHAVSGKPGLQNSDEVPGLVFSEDFLTPEEELMCIERIDAAEGPWLKDLSRRVQHYGWRYDYKARAITPDMYIGELPDWLGQLAERLYDETDLFDRVPEQVIVNEYEAWTGHCVAYGPPWFWAHRLHHLSRRRLGDGFF